MKNKIILFVITFFVGIMSPLGAEVTTNDKCLANGTCRVVCNYKNKIKRSNGDIGNAYITIYYNFDSNNFSVGIWSGLSGDGKRPYLKTGSFSKVFSKSGTNVFVQPSMGLNENNFVCPAHGYYDVDSWAGGNEICFDSDGSWCAKEAKSAGTRFGNSSENFISDEKDEDFKEQVDYYFNNLMYNDISYEDFKNGKYQSAEDLFEKVFLEDFKKNYLNGNDIPQFVYNSASYQNGVKSVKKHFDALKESWEDELKKELDEGTISESEYNKVVGNLNDIDKNFEEVGNKYKEEIDTIGAKKEALEVTPVDICSSNNTSLKAFQVVGYILMIIKIVVPLILIVLGSIDFAKAAISGDDESTKKSAVMFMKRILIGLIIFFIPTVIDFLLSLVNGVSDVAKQYENCSNCLLNPNNSSKCSPRTLSE